MALVAECGTFATGTTGSGVQLLFNNSALVPKAIILRIGQKFNTADAVNHFSEGSYDLTTNECNSQYTDGTGSQSKEYTDRSMSLWTRVGGTLGEHISGSVTATGTGSFTVTMTAADANYDIHFLALW